MIESQKKRWPEKGQCNPHSLRCSAYQMRMFSQPWLNEYLIFMQNLLQQHDNNRTTNLYLTIILCRHVLVKSSSEQGNNNHKNDLYAICVNLASALCPHFSSSGHIRGAGAKALCFQEAPMCCVCSDSDGGSWSV